MPGGSAPRAVVDTNVWVSGYLRPQGPPGRVLQAVREGRVIAVATPALAEEIAGVLQRPRLRRLGVGPGSAEEALWLLGPLSGEEAAGFPLRDPTDEPVLASALAGGASVVVTGDADLLEDRDLLALLAERGVAVERPADFLRRLSRRGGPSSPR